MAQQEGVWVEDGIYCVAHVPSLVLVVSNLSHRVRDAPILPSLSAVVGVRLEPWPVYFLRGTHVDEEFHFLLLAAMACECGLDAKLWLGLDELHVLWKLSLPLHLPQPLVVLILVFGIADLDHVFIEQPHELGLTHRLLDFAEVLNDGRNTSRVSSGSC